MWFRRKKKLPAGKGYGYRCDCCGWRCVMRYEHDFQATVADHLASDWHRENAAKA